jgi:hypothetical protein
MIPVRASSKPSEFVQLQAEAFRSFNIDNSEKSLSKGVWYPTDYLDALQANQHEKDGPRVKWMKDKNICHLGFVDRKTFDPQPGRVFTFIAKTNIAASEALKQLRGGPALLECANAVQLSIWMALHDYLGTSKFDALLSLPRDVFPPLYLQLGATILTDLYPAVAIQGEEDVMPGDICSFKNISNYPKKHPLGPAIAWNTICVQNGDGGTKFMGFGLSADGNLSAEIESIFFKEFNKEALDPHVYFSKQEAEKKVKPTILEALTWEEFQKERSVDANGVSGRLVLKVRRLRLDRIEQLKITPINDIRELIASWG